VNDWKISRRTGLQICLGLLWVPAGLRAQQSPGGEVAPPADWVCPMDPDVRATKPGICPRCGMKLVLGVPDRVEYPLKISASPELLQPGVECTLTLRVLNPNSSRPVKHFHLIHERLLHLFIVSENLEFFAHVHPLPQADGSFRLPIRLPFGGMYRLLADYYPAGAVPQLANNTLYVSGSAPSRRLAASLAPSKGENLTASLRLDPPQPLAGLESRLIYTLAPAEGLEPYLGAWAHMLAASADLIDLLHLHPFIAEGGSRAQFNVLFPRPGLYRVWTQFQRQGVVNTVHFTVPVVVL